jgi:serine/threonine protein kinase
MVKNLAFDRLTGTTLGKYHLEQLIEQNSRELVFLARTDNTTNTCRLCILARPVGMTAKEREDYQERFLYAASQIATLQHPYILPLLDYGIEHGMPYLVSPNIPMRSLRARLAKSGPLDSSTAGRYLDQIAATLEYARQHNILHGNLTVDTIFIRLDGQLVVADFGVMDLFELNRQDKQLTLLHGKSEVRAPEQLLGKPVSPSTDVYALGAVLYHLLTGSPVFKGNTPEELMQQHLYASVPPLGQRRNDLPSGLYSVVARALAKDPAQRFSQPGALANAYYRIVDPHNRTRVPFVVPSSSQHDAEAFASVVSLPEMRVPEPNKSIDRMVIDDGKHGLLPSEPQTPFPRAMPSFSKIKAGSKDDSPRPSLMRRLKRKSARRTALIVLPVLLLLVISGAIGTSLIVRQSQAGTTMTSQALFLDAQNGSPGHSDALTITANNLNAPPAGHEYVAWLIDNATEEVVQLGVLSGRNGTYALKYSGKVSPGQAGPNLLGSGTGIEVTLEQPESEVPQGNVVLRGTFPPQAFVHIQHLLVHFPTTPQNKGVLVGVLEQTRLLNMQAAVLQYLAASGNTIAVECMAQNILDLIEGTKGSNYQPLASTCALHNVVATGDGFGLLGKGYLNLSAAHASLAISQPDATSAMRLHAGLMSIALSNVTGWVSTIDRDALHLLSDPTDSTSMQEIVTLADAAYHGVDTNGDGLIDPVAGEAGAVTAYLQGQLMAALPLLPA